MNYITELAFSFLDDGLTVVLMCGDKCQVSPSSQEPFINASHTQPTHAHTFTQTHTHSGDNDQAHGRLLGSEPD